MLDQYVRIAVCFAFGLVLAGGLLTEIGRAQGVVHPPGSFVKVNSANLWVESEGTGKPILLIPSGPGYSHDYFHPQFTALADEYKVIYFDAFGRGKSERAKAPSEYTFKRDVEEIEGLRKALGLNKMIVFGHLYGGMVAIAYATKYPDRVDKLILGNTQFSAESWQSYNDAYNEMLRNQFPEASEKVLGLRAQGFHSSSPEVQKALQGLATGRMISFYDASNRFKLNTPSGAFNSDVWYVMGGDDCDFQVKGELAKLDFRVQLKELKPPVLVFAGRFDRGFLPRFAIQYKRYAPQAQFVMFEKSGHFPWVEETTEVFTTIKAFLSR